VQRLHRSRERHEDEADGRHLGHPAGMRIRRWLVRQPIGKQPPVQAKVEPGISGKVHQGDRDDHQCQNDRSPARAGSPGAMEQQGATTEGHHQGRYWLRRRKARDQGFQHRALKAPSRQDEQPGDGGAASLREKAQVHREPVPPLSRREPFRQGEVPGRDRCASACALKFFSTLTRAAMHFARR